MATFLQSALGEAMLRLKTADVAGATDAIQRALVGNALVTLILPHLLYQRLRWQAEDRQP